MKASLAKVCSTFCALPRSFYPPGYGEVVDNDNLYALWQNYRGPQPRLGGGDFPLPPSASTVNEEDIN